MRRGEIAPRLHRGRGLSATAVREVLKAGGFAPPPGVLTAVRPSAVQVRHAAGSQQYGVRKLELFGSILHPDFDPERSDVDLLVEF
ncbi:MAG: nucleotidyltransferase domain-containing protein [Steroidobacteraceae bacterium]